jgi:hypothetical protein
MVPSETPSLPIASPDEPILRAKNSDHALASFHGISSFSPTDNLHAGKCDASMDLGRASPGFLDSGQNFWGGQEA